MITSLGTLRTNFDVAFEANDSGQAVAAAINGSTPNNLVATIYDPASGWTTGATLDTDGAALSGRPAIDIDADGNAMAVWEQPTGVTDVYWSRYEAGAGWSGAQMLNTDTTYDAGDPSVTMDDAGNAIAVWLQRVAPAATPVIMARVYTRGVGWGTALRINGAEDLGTAHPPLVKLTPDGQTGMAIWGQTDGVRYNMWAARYLAGSGWQTAGKMESDDTEGGGSEIDLSVSNDGKFLGLMGMSTGTMFSITNTWGNLFTPGSGWGTAQKLETDDSGSSYPLWGGGTFADDGTAHAFWNQNYGPGNTYRLMWTRNSGSGWQTARQVGEDLTTGAIPYSDAAVDRFGNVVVVFISATGIASSRFNPMALLTGAWSDQETVATTGVPGLPKVSIINDCGDAMATWSSGTTPYVGFYR